MVVSPSDRFTGRFGSFPTCPNRPQFILPRHDELNKPINFLKSCFPSFSGVHWPFMYLTLQHEFSGTTVVDMSPVSVFSYQQSHEFQIVCFVENMYLIKPLIKLPHVPVGAF